MKSIIRRLTPRWLWAKVAPLRFRAQGFDERYGGERYRGEDAPFDEIYAKNHWQDLELASGCGSTLAYTAPLRAALPPLVRKLGVKTFLDAPCGDFNWMQHVDLGEGVRYLGRDVVPALIADVKAKFEAPNREFAVMNIITDEPPQADVWHCRDVLIHLSNEDGVKVLRNFARSKVKYLLTTTYDYVTDNRDVEMGGFRYINLQKPPYNLPRPRAKLEDFIVPEAPRYVALWSREDVAKAVGL